MITDEMEYILVPLYNVLIDPNDITLASNV